MTKSDLILAVAECGRLTKTAAESVVNTVLGHCIAPGFLETVSLGY